MMENMSQQMAQQLFRDGGTFVLLDVPLGTEFGIDWNAWNTAEKFKGVKMIPPGVHYIYYSACNKDGCSAPRTGFFHHFTRGEVLVRRWDAYNEDLSDVIPSDDEVTAIKHNLQQLDKNLGAYPYDQLKKWFSLTNYMGEELVTRMQPLCGKISSVSQVLPDDRTAGNTDWKPENSNDRAGNTEKQPDDTTGGDGNTDKSADEKTKEETTGTAEDKTSTDDHVMDSSVTNSTESDTSKTETNAVNDKHKSDTADNTDTSVDEKTKEDDKSSSDDHVMDSSVTNSDTSKPETNDKDKRKPGETPPSRRKQTNEEKLLPAMHYVPGTNMRFTEIPSQRYPTNASPATITKYCIDSSYQLEKLLTSQEEDLLGELQLAFICFILGHVYDAFEHWKRLTHVLCTSDEALTNHPMLYQKLISCLHYQISEVPEDFFVDIISSSNFLVTTLHELFSNIESHTDLDKTLVTRANKFKLSLTHKFNWDFSSEPEDYEPVIVDMT